MDSGGYTRPLRLQKLTEHSGAARCGLPSIKIDGGIPGHNTGSVIPYGFK